jgi:hypothetical protein
MVPIIFFTFECLPLGRPCSSWDGAKWRNKQGNHNACKSPKEVSKFLKQKKNVLAEKNSVLVNYSGGFQAF